MLNQSQLETIKQILTLRYSTNLKTIAPRLIPNNFQVKHILNPEEKIEEIIRKTISNNLNSNSKNVGIALSSGIDSTLILALLRKEFPSIEIQSVSVKFSESVDETEASKKISENFHTNHHVLQIDNFLEELPKAISIVKQPFWDLHWYYLVKKMKELTNVFLSGDGGDELFGGYVFRYKKFLELTDENSTNKEKILSYLNCHERDWIPEQEKIFGKNCKFSWNEIYQILEPYFSNSLPSLTQVFLADFNGKLLHNMQPLYELIHQNFNIQNITPILNEQLIQLSCNISNELKFNVKNNTGKYLLKNLLNKYEISHLLSTKKQGFSVNTINMWNSYAKKIFSYYFDNSRLIEDKLINSDFINQYSQKNGLDVRYVNKFLGILALEIWYRIFITKDLNPNTKLEY